MSYNYLFSLIMVGDAYVGKTALCNSLTMGDFIPSYENTIGIEFASHKIQYTDDLIIKAHIWDTAGQEVFAPIVANYYRRCAGVFLVFDVNKRESFNRLGFWRREVMKNTDYKGISFLLIGNKVDKAEREVSYEEGSQYAEKHNMLYVETSAKKFIHIDRFFRLLISDVYNKMDKNSPGIKKGGITQLNMCEELPVEATTTTCCHMM
jgi:small GTP-binding protein